MGELQVEIRPETVSLLKELILKPTQHEVGGILLGTVQPTEKGFKLDILGAIGAKPHESFIKEFHYDHLIWRDLYSVKAVKYPDLAIVGWYRTSTGAGLVPSSDDVAIQKAFFKDEHQVLLLANPDGFKHCVFQWDKNFLVPLDETGDEPGEFNAEREQIFAAPSNFPELSKEIEKLVEQSSLVSSQVSSMLENKHTETVEAATQTKEPVPLGIKVMMGLASVLTLITLLVYPLIKTADTSDVSSAQVADGKQATQPISASASAKKPVPPPSSAPVNKTADQAPNPTSTTTTTKEGVSPSHPVGNPTAGKLTGTNTYVVQPGDSLWKISEKLYGSGFKCYLLISANGLTTPNRLNSGLVLMVPPDK
ncbi:MAG TPA: LysM peptidoglycan-binding domain-containing protein [Bacillota bacterium]|nr:LysM peptidoglycan-binding domain-containing protein [Bacillota bacterium]